MYSNTKVALTVFAAVALPMSCLLAQDTKPASDGKAPEKSESPKPTDRASEPANKSEKAAPTRVTGIGGVFIKARDPVALRAWYKTHLGIDVQKFGGAVFRWGDSAEVPANAKTAWFVGNGSTFKPSESSFMINYRVADLRGLLKLLREEGCQVLDKVEESEFGIFGWVMDPEGNKVELWQPPKGQ
jgi:predicted enzyme related to lactoylglutathione lyase